jgi:uncharacterized membrane protein YheB (UPF0754 family)
MNTEQLIKAVLSAFDLYIAGIVDKRVSEILLTQASLNAINEETTKRIETLINEAIESHTSSEEHLTREQVEEIVTDELEDHCSSADHLSEDDVTDKVRDAVGDLSFTVEVN